MKKSYFASAVRRRASRVLFAAAICILPTGAGAVGSTDPSVPDTRPNIAKVEPAQQILTVSCMPQEVAVFDSRVHVKCTEDVIVVPLFVTLRYFAVPTSSSSKAASFLNPVTAAYTSGRPLSISFDLQDLSAASFGCLNADCREPLTALF